MQYDLKEIYNSFLVDGSFSNAELCGSGHIHDTFYIRTSEPESDDYILQRLNNHVFKNIPELQENIERVTKHIHNKLLNIPGADLKRESLSLVFNKSGKSWLNDNDSNYWRMFIYIPNHRSYDIVDSPDKAYQGGKAIGRFQAMLADFPGEPLHDTIPYFQDIEKRLETFHATLKEDRVKRAPEAREEINSILERSDKMNVILRLGREGLIPLRITHNDTKFNNVLLDENDKALCIIDLDTVMQGYVHYDFGDAIRTAANTAAEDERDLEKININIELFKAFAEGYLSETRNTINIVEKEYLAFSPILITYTQAVRFLTDYLDGDSYYKIHHEFHNLERTKAQLRLVESMEHQYSYMQKIIEKLS
jgi:thiamine kinase-like enzyme